MTNRSERNGVSAAFPSSEERERPLEPTPAGPSRAGEPRSASRFGLRSAAGADAGESFADFFGLG